MTTQKTNIQIGNEVIELTGEDLTAFKAQRTIASRESALAKLADLGLTAEEVASL